MPNVTSMTNYKDHYRWALCDVSSSWDAYHEYYERKYCPANKQPIDCDSIVRLEYRSDIYSCIFPYLFWNAKPRIYDNDQSIVFLPCKQLPMHTFNLSGSIALTTATKLLLNSLSAIFVSSFWLQNISSTRSADESVNKRKPNDPATESDLNIKRKYHLLLSMEKNILFLKFSIS